ncbi:lipopolysaccharide biosynthesis protein RfbH [candidate division FCPU426 bacterium]|nr:lipopolysaccharide biosynthesis protein RfbH [candidate division FCPU426 bacterium]
MSKEEALRREILAKTAEYCRVVHLAGKKFIPGESKVVYGGRVFDEQEVVNLVDSALEFWLTSGRFSMQCEKRLADFLGVPYCSLCNSGSSANLLAFMALTSPDLGERRIDRGDEVITVAVAFPTTVAPMVQYGAVPVFIDVAVPDFNPDVTQLEAALSPRTKAVVLAHTLGNPFNVRAVKDFCQKNNLWLIEDNCDSLGSVYDHQYTGTFGDIGTSSFYPPHHITMGEGGAVYTRDQEIWRRLNSLRDWGRDCWCPTGQDNTCGARFNRQYGSLPEGFDHKFVYSHFGYNLKMTDLQAAVGCAQMDKLPDFIQARKNNYQYLLKGLGGLEDAFIFPEALPEADPCWFGFLLAVKPKAGFSRNEITRFLEDKNIQTRTLFAGNVVRHPCFTHLVEGKDYRLANKLINTDYILHHAFWIGVFPGLSKDMLDYMIKQIRIFVKK